MEVLSNIVRTIEYYPTDEWRGKKVSEFLTGQGYPQSALTRLRHEPDVLQLNGNTIFMNHRINGGDRLAVRITGDHASDKIVPANIPIDIVYEDEDILVVNKSAAMPVHPSINHYENTLANAVAYHLGNNGVYRCINRLDRDTTGLTIIAKHYLAAGILSIEMKERRINREYTALVQGVLQDNTSTIDAPIARKAASTVEREVRADGEKAITHYAVVKRLENSTLVNFKLDTGRTHQIRVHMKYIGHPLLGDFLYNPENRDMSRQALHAGRLSFLHPITGNAMEFEVPIPEDMSKCISDMNEYISDTNENVSDINGFASAVKMNRKWKCPCCGYNTLTEEPGGYDICKVCFWEDDPVQRRDITMEGGANTVSLQQARINYEEFGASDSRYISHVRKPTEDEMVTEDVKLTENGEKHE